VVDGDGDGASVIFTDGVRRRRCNPELRRSHVIFSQTFLRGITTIVTTRATTDDDDRAVKTTRVMTARPVTTTAMTDPELIPNRHHNVHPSSVNRREVYKTNLHRPSLPSLPCSRSQQQQQQQQQQAASSGDEGPAVAVFVSREKEANFGP